MDITDWITASATTASFIVAALATAIAWTVHKREHSRTEQAALKEEQDQANLVSAWEESRPLSITGVPEGILSESQRINFGNGVYVHAIFMSIVNRSNQPVYDFEVKAEGITSIFKYAIVPPGEKEIGPLRYAINDFFQEEYNISESRLNLSFRDASGSWWVRKAQGDLVKVTSLHEHGAAMGPAYQRLQEELKNFKPLGTAE
ncbi:hypothetical protein [Arthrobacter sp. AQ5-05]|uniref:hypothetical protein n=1 Tax=Arthrobacter sp. AQ5-05 TaxID=2184581 RepID=UPI0012B5594D|nr:hypothetical protein [Arthrobacter sp. AQ5-05]